MRAARPDDSPGALLTRSLDARLRADHRDVFAGIVWRSNHELEVFAVGDATRLRDAVHDVHRATAPDVAVRITGGMTSTLAELEDLHEQLRMRSDAIAAVTGPISGFGVDVLANRERIELIEPSREAVDFLERTFGADRILVARGGGWRPV